MCNKVGSKDPFVPKYCVDWYKTQEMCDKAFDAVLPTLKFVPDRFVISKIIKNLEEMRKKKKKHSWLMKGSIKLL